MLMRSTSMPAHTAYRLLPASVFIISKRTPRSLTCTLLSLSSPVPRIPLRPPQGTLASPQYSSTASYCYHFLLLFSCPLSACSDIHSLLAFLLLSFLPSCLFFFLSSPILKYNVRTSQQQSTVDKDPSAHQRLAEVEEVCFHWTGQRYNSFL